MTEEEFACFQDSPWVIWEALECKNPREQLRAYQIKIAEIEGETEFSEIRPSIIKLAVVHHANDPRSYLRSISEEEEFSCFTPWLIRHVIFSYQNAREALRKTIRTANELASEPEFRECSLPCLLDEILTCPNNPRESLRKRMKTANGNY